MRRALVLFVLVPLAIVVVVLSVANRASVTFSLDPFGGDPPALSLTAPLFIFLFATLFLGILIGGVAAWIRQGRWRSLARAERAELQRTRQEVERLRERVTELTSGTTLPANRDAA
ncbi:MAG: LapA family protein [Rhizobiales bacterium]|nr:LapA family protein [Hyphomicrobiales bacterium]